MASSTGLTLPVALVATGAVVGTGATTAMTAPVATRATPRPSTRRVWRAYVHDHPHRARRPSRARCPRPRRAPASAAPTTRLCTGIHAHPVNTPESARPVRAAARACVCSLRVRTHAAAGHASAAHCCRTLPGPAGLRPAARSCRALSWLSGAGAVLGLGLGPRNSLCSGPSMRHRPLDAAVHVRARTLVCIEETHDTFPNGNNPNAPIRDPIMWKKEENLRVRIPSTEENISHMLDLRMCFKRASGFDFSSTKT